MHDPQAAINLIDMDSQQHIALAQLAWQIDLGADEAMSETPINRYDIAEKAPKPVNTPAAAPTGTPTPPVVQAEDPVAIAQSLAKNAPSLDALRAAQTNFDHCELKQGARNLVFSDGNPDARLMVIGEAPGANEDREGKPFVGAAGQMLDAMLAAINHGRDHAENPVYITNIIPWRPPQNRDPKPDEIAMMLPFVQRHIELVAPDILILMGNIACQAMLGRKGITKLRGTWEDVQGKPAMPMFHPAYMLRNPIAKRDAWHDLLMVQNRLRP